jgi:uncharacterized membrane protein YraQ (UPF0718 family)
MRRSRFAGGASAAAALAFQFASTNLVVELGVVLWVLIGWQFTLAELVGGLVMIAIMTVLLRLFISKRLEAQAREHATSAEAGHQHHSAGDARTSRERLSSIEAWSDVAHNFRNDWAMLYREIATGFLLAGFIGLLGNGFFNAIEVLHEGRTFYLCSEGCAQKLVGRHPEPEEGSGTTLEAHCQSQDD